MDFPIEIMGVYYPLKFDISQPKLTARQKEQLTTNTQLLRDCLVFMTAYAKAKGVGAHTGGALDIVPEVLIIDGFTRGNPDLIHPILYDEAGHRVALQYLWAALDERIENFDLERLLDLRCYQSGLPGHPELNPEQGIYFSSGRLGHTWPDVNGIAERVKDKKIIVLGSDGSQQEGNNAEAARYAVAHKLNLLLLIDDNDITIEGRPSEYMSGFDLEKTLKGHGLQTFVGEGENFDSSYKRIREGLLTNDRTTAVINKRVIAPGIGGIENLPKAHEAIAVDLAIAHLEKQGYAEAVERLNSAEKPKRDYIYLGSSRETGKNRSVFGKVVCEIMDEIGPEKREEVLVFSNDLGDSTGIGKIRDAFPKRYRKGGIQERHNFSAAGGFGSAESYQGIDAGFSAFLEMIISEITMSRLNKRNVLAHFSHAGVDDMADNTCHYGINISFADNGFVEDDNTRLYFPADPHQMKATVRKIFYDSGLRFVFSTRSATPYILNEEGEPFFAPENGYQFIPDKDDLIRKGTAGYVVTYGCDMLYRCLDAVERAKKEGLDVGLVNRPTLNVIDEEMLERAGISGFVLFVESQNQKTGFGNRYAKALLEGGYHPKFKHLAVVRPGEGGLIEQIPHQGLDQGNILRNIISLYQKTEK